jgi:hypothetical protein
MSGQILNPITVEPGPAKRSAMGAGIEDIGGVSLLGMLTWAAVNAIYLIAVGLAGLLG